MTTKGGSDPWPKLREVVAAAMSGLQDGRFMEETLESLCVQLGASSAWSTLETQGSEGPLHRSRTAGFRGVAPAVLAIHVNQVLTAVQTERKTISGAVDYAKQGSFIAVPLWSRPAASTKGRTFVGALYLEFTGDQGLQPINGEFAESVGGLLGGMIAQQSVIEASKEDLRIQKALEGGPEPLSLEWLLSSPSMQRIAEELRGAMTGDASVMLLGESGSGKTQLATAFARATHREPIVRATLGMADDLNTITSELFGHERGAFSGAVSKRKGLVEYADGGTLILDEVLNLPPTAQQLLLDFTQFGWYRPLGYEARDPKTAKVRIISVTNGDIHTAIEDGRFRQDLYYRLAVVPITLPPLRERQWDIPEIAVRYLTRTDARDDWTLSDDAVDALTDTTLRWSGNVRELEAVMERARNRWRGQGATEPVITVSQLDLDQVQRRTPEETQESEPVSPAGEADERNAIRQRWEELIERKVIIESDERETIEDALRACGGTIAKAARLLGLPRTGLISRMGKLGIDAKSQRV